MKRTKIIYLLATLLALASCSTSDTTELVLYGDAAVTSFTLGTMNRYVDGVKSTYDGSKYPFYVDHMKREISNVDSLPAGTDVKHALVKVTSLHNAQVGLELDPKGDTLFIFTAADSLDLSSTRYLRVYATDGSGYTRYKVDVKVHKQEGDSVVWRRLPTVDHFAGMSDLKAQCFDGKLYVFGNEGGQTTGYVSSDKGESWSAVTLPAGGLNDQAWSNLVGSSDSLYIMNGQTIWRTVDGATWQADNSTFVNGTTQRTQLFGYGTVQLYALTNENGIASKFRPEFLDIDYWAYEDRDNDDRLPTDDVTSVTYPLAMSDSTDVILLAGNRQVEVNGKTVWRTQLWRQVFDYSTTGLISQFKQTGLIGSLWSYIEDNGYNPYLLPAMEHVQILRYDDMLIALGGDALNADGVPACFEMYKSRDNGITWKEDYKYAMPPTDAASGEILDSNLSSLAAAVDNENYIYIICAGTGEVWRGRLNRLGW